jgi:hypothetical protein
MPARPGSWRVGRGFLPRSMRVADQPTKTANSAASRRPSMRVASQAPAYEAGTMAGAMRRTMSQRTAP